MFNSNDYAKDRTYRADKMREAARDHLAKQVTDQEWKLQSLRRIRIVIVAVIAVVILAALPGSSRAAGGDMIDPGTDEPFAEAILAYRLGHYYYVSGQYDRAIEHYTEAIDSIPAVVFEKADTYRVMYWDMGDALLMAGQYDEALASYQHYVALMDGSASAEAVAFVERLEDGIAQQVVNLTPLTG